MGKLAPDKIVQNLLRPSCGVLLLSIATMACQTVDRVSATQDRPQFFASRDAVVTKAKEDFVAALRANKDLKLGVDLATLERSQPGRPVRRVDLDFDKLVGADSTKPFDTLIRNERTTVVPFVVDGTVVTIVEVNRDERGWKVVGLAGKSIADELTIIRGAIGDPDRTDITLFEVPNLQTRVYGVKRDGADLLFTDYGQRFVLQRGVSAAALIPVLQSAAIDFQRQYGETLKKRKLVR